MRSVAVRRHRAEGGPERPSNGPLPGRPADRRASQHSCPMPDFAIGTGATQMSHAIIRGKNGRRHEVDFGEAPIRVEVYASGETIEIFVEADYETLPEERRRFAIVSIPRQQFSQATGNAARRAAIKMAKDDDFHTQ
jgi:hypothetical protein